MNEPQPASTGIPVATELHLREILIVGLHDLAQDEYRLRELVARPDLLPGGSQEHWTDELVFAFCELMNPEREDALNFRLGYPLGSAELPCVSILKEAAAEDSGGAVVGDVIARRAVEVGSYEYTTLAEPSVVKTAPKLEEHIVLGTAETTTLQVGVWATSPELSLLIDAAVRSVLVREKRRLISSGVYEVSFSEGGFQPDATVQVELRVGYVPIQRVTMDWIRGQTKRKRLPNRIRIHPGGVVL